MKRIIIVTTLLMSAAMQAAQADDWQVIGESKPASSWTVAQKPAEGSKSDIAIGNQKDTTVAKTPEPAKKPEAEKKAEPAKPAGLISSPTTALIAGSALDLTKTLLVGPSAKSEGGKGSTWTGNLGIDIQNQGLDQTSLGTIGTDITNLSGGTTQIQFAGGGNTSAQQVNKKK